MNTANSALRTWKVMAMAAATAAAFALGPATASATLVNGGFEEGDFTGWTLGDPLDAFTNVDCFGAPVIGFDVASGFCSASLGALETNTLSQSFATTPGTEYVLSFALLTDGNVPAEFSALLDGAAFFSVSDPAAAGSFTTISTHFLAQSAESTVLFSFSNPTGFFRLDDVTVAQVPEPGTVALLALAMLGLVLRRRRG